VPERLSGTRQRISVQFTVDSNGNVVDILSRAPGKELEREATRVISKLPKMTPAKKKNKNVDMIYQIPIVVQAEH
jgi:protein TonB